MNYEDEGMYGDVRYSYSYDEKNQDPIDFQFRTAREDYDGRDRREDDGERISARRDLLTEYTRTKMGKMKVAISSMLIGYGFGTFISKAIHLPNVGTLTITSSAVIGALLLNCLRTVYSELLKSLALVLILTVTKMREIRKRYPCLPHIKSILQPRTCPRRPFPYEGNPWQYDGERYEEFNMIYTVGGMCIAGAVVGGNVPLIPTFVGAPLAGGAFAFACTMQNPKVRQ